MTIYLTLKDKNTGKLLYSEINPLREFFRKNPLGTIDDWIKERGNQLHSTPSCTADLELISYFVR
jgi:hypothetical protein